MMTATLSDTVRDVIRSIPDFPKPGILFRDYTPILKNPQLLGDVIAWFAAQFENQTVDYIVGIESRGFTLGIALAQKMGIGFVPARKRGKLPGRVEQFHYDLEYGSDCIEMQADAIEPGSRVVVVDDLLATGGTLGATAQLIERLGGKVVSAALLIELTALQGRQRLPVGMPVCTLVEYND